MPSHEIDMQSVNGMLPTSRGQFIDKSATSEEFGDEFMNELNQFEFEINNERQRRHSQQRNQYGNGEQSLNATAAGRSSASGKKIVRKKRHSKPRPDDDGGGGSSSAGGGGGSRKSHYRSAAKAAAGKVKRDDQMDEYSSSPYSSDEERYSSGPESPPIYDDEYQSTEVDTPFKQQQQQQFDANSKNGHFVEATNLLSESEPYTQQQYYAINEQFENRISKDGGRIVTDETDDNLELVPNFQSKNDSEKGSVQNIDSTDIGSPSTDHTFHKEQSLTSEVSTDVIDDSASAAAKDPTKSATESGSSETPTFKSRMNKVLSQDSQDSNGGLGSSKWKLLKTLKEKRIEEKNNQEKIKEEENAKDKASVSRCVTKLTRNSFTRFISIEQLRSTKKKNSI